MESTNTSDSTTTNGQSAAALHTLRRLRRTPLYRLFAAVYTCGLISLFYHHSQNLLHSTNLVSSFISLSFLFSDVILAFLWLGGQSFRMRPIRRKEFPENLKRAVASDCDFPALDVFICTADPNKEPPVSVVNTALSAMAYDYPAEKVSVYVSDDGGSELTLFAFAEAAKFAGHWLPFCQNNKVVDRCPEAYFASKQRWCSESDNIKAMYEAMKLKVEHAVDIGRVSDEYLTDDQDRQIFDTWANPGFTRQDHPAVIQVLLESGKDRDVSGHSMPNLIYVSREKSKTSPHNFKAGALNALVRASAIMTNAPIILTLDCDTYSNDPVTPLRALCYISDPKLSPKLGYVQFPQCFRGLNSNDIYNSELLYLFKINSMGMDGASGPNYVGSGCFFRRRCFFGPPSFLVPQEIPELCPNHVVDKPIRAQPVLALAHKVAGCNFELKTTWGSKMGFRYGSLVEDFNTGYLLQCDGWRGVFSDPERPAFLGDIPTTLFDSANQLKRWSLGLLEVGFSKFSPMTYGVRALGPVMALTYAHYAFWPIYSIPVTTYAFLPQLALLNGLAIFPKVSEPWFWLYTFLFLGSYGQDYLDFALCGGTFMRWWSHQRIWLIRSVTSFMFGSFDFLLKILGISRMGFNVTSKVVDDEQRKRYDQGMFDFGIVSPMFVPLVMAATINLYSFLQGLVLIFGNGKSDLIPHLLISGFIVLNCLPIYEAMVLRRDRGKIALKISVVSVVLVLGMCRASAVVLGN